MSQKKQSLSRSQIYGIVWLSGALLLIAGIAFFYSKKPTPPPPDPSQTEQADSILTQKEDSIYQARRNKKRNNMNYKPIQHGKNAPQVLPSPSQSRVASKKPLMVEINSADTLTLQLLYGIGPAFAQRIVRYRERLGGFAHTGQLLEVYGFTPERLGAIANNISIDTSLIHRIAINSTGLKQLSRHPYIEYYQARDIVRLRQAGVVFRSEEDLRAVPSMADSTLQRLLPYLDYSMGDSTVHPTETTIR